MRSSKWLVFIRSLLAGFDRSLTPVLSQCAADYHYSRTKAAETEMTFQISEEEYCRCLDKIISGKTLTDIESGNLLVTMFDFHVRNAAHINRTGKEGIEAYNLRSRTFVHDIMLRRKAGVTTKEEFVDHIQRYWSLRILCSAAGHHFITSDHPSAWVCLIRSRPALHMVLLPLTPNHIAVAYDKRILNILNVPITLRDEQILNEAQIINAVNCVYTTSVIAEEDIGIIKEHLGHRSGYECEVTEDSWGYKLQGIYQGNHFSFIRLNPPIL